MRHLPLRRPAATYSTIPPALPTLVLEPTSISVRVFDSSVIPGVSGRRLGAGIGVFIVLDSSADD